MKLASSPTINAGVAKVVVRKQIALKNCTSQVVDCVLVAGADRPARTTTSGVVVGGFWRAGIFGFQRTGQAGLRPRLG